LGHMPTPIVREQDVEIQHRPE